MLLYFQAALALFGVGLVLAGRLRFRQRELSVGMGSLAGAIWLAPVPLTIWIGNALAVAGLFAERSPAGAMSLPERYAWVHVAITVAAFLFGSLVLALGLITGRAEADLPDAPPSAPVSPSELLERAPRQAGTGITTAPVAVALPTSAPPAPEGIARVKPAGDGLPAEVEALGEAEGLFRPWALCRWLGLDTPTYILYPGALVIADGEEFVIVPWHLAERLHENTLTAGGEQFPVSSMVLNGARLEARINDHIARRLVPRALAQVRGGGRATFGVLAVDDEGILYRGKRAEWERVIAVGAYRGSVVIRVREAMMPWAVPLADVPNATAFVALVRELQPGLEREVV